MRVKELGARELLVAVEAPDGDGDLARDRAHRGHLRGHRGPGGALGPYLPAQQ